MRALTLVIVKADSVLLNKEPMENLDPKVKTDSQDLLRLLKDIFALELTAPQEEKLKLFMAGKGSLSLDGRKYTKEDLKDLFYSQG
jgi:hypothetical protein